MNHIIMLDVHGVLANWDRAAIQASGIPIEENDINCWDWFASYMSHEDFWKKISDTMYFWEDLEPYKNADQIFDICREFGQVVFVTAPPAVAGQEDAASGTLKWLRKHGFLKPDGRNYYITPHKHLLAGRERILIDDNTGNVEHFRRCGGNAVLYPSNTNRRLLSWRFMGDDISDVQNDIVKTGIRDIICKRSQIEGLLSQ